MDILDRNSEEVQSFTNQLAEIMESIEFSLKNSKPLLDGEHYLGNKEVCRILNISQRTLQDYRDKGVISFYKLEGKILFKESDILKLLEDNYYEAWNEDHKKRHCP
ncbi:DNA-binding protein [Dysgonomonas sp. 216]|uniref:helix-turn-helix domain-containing protein n=1 Tax=Dysgonomonas sp. 216 TaxID=2302934 RepID=UPI0013D81155|nr:helix-turn-helix domain-containing protein [Dysgonomonas sp. 216]NDW17967.1 DNA-binding protein [Dysgonomonas sp. 216]